MERKSVEKNELKTNAKKHTSTSKYINCSLTKPTLCYWELGTINIVLLALEFFCLRNLILINQECLARGRRARCRMGGVQCDIASKPPKKVKGEGYFYSKWQQKTPSDIKILNTIIGSDTPIQVCICSQNCLLTFLFPSLYPFLVLKIFDENREAAKNIMRSAPNPPPIFC